VCAGSREIAMDDWKQIALTMLLAMTLFGYCSLIGAATHVPSADDSASLAIQDE
jgi:hypothetical protein